MNIGIINESFSMGGVERVSIELANSLQSIGHEVSLIDFSGLNEFYYNVNNDVQRVKIFQPPTFKQKLVGKIMQYRYSMTNKSININFLYKKQTKDLTSYLKTTKYDVLILSQGKLTSLIPEIKKEVPNIKIIAWQHNEYDIYINQYYKKYINEYKLGIKEADLVICLTETDQKKFKKLNKNSSFIYNPLTIRNTNKISNLKNKNIIFVGRLSMEQKGLDYLIKIGKQISNEWKILVAGNGPDEEEFRELIKIQKLKEKVILKGSLNNKELKELYLSGSIFILTSRWEGFGLVITEAMSFGLPVISFNNNGPREILNNGEYGVLVEKNNINEFITKLNELIENPLKTHYYQGKSIERVKDFNIDSIIEEWNKKIMDLCS